MKLKEQFINGPKYQKLLRVNAKQAAKIKKLKKQLGHVNAELSTMSKALVSASLTQNCCMVLTFYQGTDQGRISEVRQDEATSKLDFS